MYRVLLKNAMVILLSAVLLLTMTAIASAAGSQRWNLDSETTTPGREMEKTTGPDTSGQIGSVVIDAGSNIIWIADQAAASDVTFPNGSWVITIETDEDWGDYCSASIGGWNTTTGWYDISTVTGTHFSWENGVLIVEIQTSPGTIYDNDYDYLALRIDNSDSTTHTVITDGDSSVTSPVTDPGYPLVELATGILFGIGLLGIAGYLLFRQNRGVNVM